MEKVKNDLLMDSFYEACACNNLRVTPQRVVIYKELGVAKDHPSADMLYKRVREKLPNISFDTVYRTVLSFSRIGLVRVVEGYGEEKRFDPDIKYHHHFRCLKCHRIIDFYSDFCKNLKVPPELKDFCNVLNKKVILEGTCKKCS